MGANSLWQQARISGCDLLLGALGGRRRRGQDADVVHDAEVGGGHDDKAGEAAAAGRPVGLGQVPMRQVVQAIC